MARLVHSTGQPRLYRFTDDEGTYVVDEPQILKIYHEHWKQKVIEAGKPELVDDYRKCIHDFRFEKGANEWDYSKESWIERLFCIRCSFCGRIRWAWQRCLHRIMAEKE